MLSKYRLSITVLLLRASIGINVTIWDSPTCTGIGDMRRLYLVPDDGCFVRGQYEVDLELVGQGGRNELAVSASINDPASESEFVIFFTSEDCNPDNVIDGAWLDDKCSSLLENEKVADYKSWAVWDMCMGDVGCSLEE